MITDKIRSMIAAGAVNQALDAIEAMRPADMNTPDGHAWKSDCQILFTHLQTTGLVPFCQPDRLNRLLPGSAEFPSESGFLGDTLHLQPGEVLIPVIEKKHDFGFPIRFRLFRGRVNRPPEPPELRNRLNELIDFVCTELEHWMDGPVWISRDELKELHFSVKTIQGQERQFDWDSDTSFDLPVCMALVSYIFSKPLPCHVLFSAIVHPLDGTIITPASILEKVNGCTTELPSISQYFTGIPTPLVADYTSVGLFSFPEVLPTFFNKDDAINFTIAGQLFTKKGTLEISPNATINLLVFGCIGIHPGDLSIQSILNRFNEKWFDMENSQSSQALLLATGIEQFDLRLVACFHKTSLILHSPSGEREPIIILDHTGSPLVPGQKINRSLINI